MHCERCAVSHSYRDVQQQHHGSHNLDVVVFTHTAATDGDMAT